MSNDLFAEFFTDPDTAIGFVQGAVRRALDTNQIDLSVTNKKIQYFVDKNIIAEYCIFSKSLLWRNGCTKIQEKLINAHAFLFADYFTKNSA